MSEPRPDTPDTGAGTPLDDAEHPPTDEESDRAIEIWRRHWPHLDWGAAVAVNLADRLDAARSRPATDPAGLDVLRASMEAFAAARDADVRANRDAPDNINEIVAAAIRGWLARLSVADGPGPEERRAAPEERRAALRELTQFSEEHEPTSALSRPLPENREEPSR